MSYKTHTKEEAKQLERGKWKKRYTVSYNLQSESENKEIFGAKNCSGFTKRVLDRHRRTQNFQG